MNTASTTAASAAKPFSVTVTAKVATALKDPGAYRAEDTVRISDSAAAIEALTVAQIDALSNVDLFDATGNRLSLTVAQALAIGGARLNKADTIKIVDTADNINQAMGGLLEMADKIDGIDTSDAGTVKMTVDQFKVLGTRGLQTSDRIEVADSGANLQAGLSTLTSHAAKIDAIAATDGKVVLTAQAAVLLADKLRESDHVTVADTGQKLGAGMARLLPHLDKIDAIDATDDKLKLNTAQQAAVTGARLSDGDVVTVADSGTKISASLAALLKDKFKLDLLDASDNRLQLSAAQVAELGVSKLNASDNLTVTDTAAGLAAQWSALVGATDKIDAVRLVDSGANIAAGLAGLGNNLDLLKSVDASDNALTLTVTQEALVKATRLMTSDVVTVKDSAANLMDGLTALSNDLGKIDRFDVQDNAAFNVTVAQFNKITAARLLEEDNIVVKDSQEKLISDGAGMLATKGTKIDAFASADGKLKLTVGQLNGLTTAKVLKEDAITVDDSAAELVKGIDAWTAGDLEKIDAVTATDALVLTAAQEKKVGAARLDADDNVTVADTAANILANVTGLTADRGKLDTIRVADTGAKLLEAMASLGAQAALIDSIDAQDNVLTLSVANERLLTASRLTADDVVTIADTAEQIRNYATQLGNDIDKIDRIDAEGTLLLSVAEMATITAGRLLAEDDIVIYDSALAIGQKAASWTPQELSRIDRVESSGPILLTQAAVMNIGSARLTGENVITISDTSDNIVKVIEAFQGAELDKIDRFDAVATANNSGILKLTVPQAVRVVNKLTADDTITVQDAGVHIAANLDLLCNNVTMFDTVQVANDGTINLTAVQMAKVQSSGLHLVAGAIVVTADGTTTVAGTTSKDVFHFVASDAANFDLIQGLGIGDQLELLAADGSAAGAYQLQIAASAQAVAKGQWYFADDSNTLTYWNAGFNAAATVTLTGVKTVSMAAGGVLNVTVLDT
jgi:hypothetical protein